jgi:hypothetical protein
LHLVSTLDLSLDDYYHTSTSPSHTLTASKSPRGTSSFAESVTTTTTTSTSSSAHQQSTTSSPLNKSSHKTTFATATDHLKNNKSTSNQQQSINSKNDQSLSPKANTNTFTSLQSPKQSQQQQQQQQQQQGQTHGKGVVIMSPSYKFQTHNSAAPSYSTPRRTKERGSMMAEEEPDTPDIIAMEVS